VSYAPVHKYSLLEDPASHSMNGRRFFNFEEIGKSAKKFLQKIHFAVLRGVVPLPTARDLLNAIQALSQVSYAPVQRLFSFSCYRKQLTRAPKLN